MGRKEKKTFQKLCKATLGFLRGISNFDFKKSLDRLSHPDALRKNGVISNLVRCGNE